MTSDFSELLQAFNGHDVKYLVVGAHALAVYGHVRATKDLDIWVSPNRENAKRVFAALAAFGVPLGDLTEDDLSEDGTIFQIGVPPLRIDLITSIDAVEFSNAWPDRFKTFFGDVPVPVISRQHLIKNKRAVGRLQDLADAEMLETSNSQS
jgi:hypothetical protein